MSLPVDGEREETGTAPAGDPSPPIHEPDKLDYSSLLDLQDERVRSESKNSTRLLLLSGGCLFVVFVFYCMVTTSNRRAVARFFQNLEASRHDMEPINNSKPNAVDDVLQKLGSRSTDVDNASRSLGTDPSTVKEDGMDPEMKEMMGGEGRTPGDRQRVVQGLAHLAGVELVKPTGKEIEVAKPKAPKAPKVPKAPKDPKETKEPD